MGQKIVRYLRYAIQVLFRQSPARAAVASFLVCIIIGTILLMLPISSAQQKWTAPVDALFTSTSAVCVTGLIVKTTPVYWSLFGQIVILGLIQAGGLGIMTLSAFLAITLMRTLSLRFESMMSDLVRSHGEENIWDLIKFICKFTLVMEVLGTIGFFLSWHSDFDSFWRCLYVSVFHSISAFCNAGFSLYADSFMRYRDTVGVNAVACILIVTGGIGFIVVKDVRSYLWRKVFARKGRRPFLSTHSKLVLTVTGMLLLAGFVGVLVMESFGQTLSAAPVKGRVMAAIFHSVTARTAGFNTMKLSPGTIAGSTAFLLMALMFIGGSPGSTAGGIKTSTLGVMICSIRATLKGRSKAELFHHSISSQTVHRVASIILLAVSALVTGIFLLLITERGVGFLEVAFEATSAFGTVGLTLGITPELSAPGRLIITALMFVGRLGPITLLMSLARLEDRTPYSYPHALVMVG